MKKILKFLGGAALAATVIPYAYKKNQETDEKTIQALLWKASIQPDSEVEGKKKFSLTVGFNSPFVGEGDGDTVIYPEEAELFVGEPDYAPVCECECTDECAEVNECCCEGDCCAVPVAEAVEEVAEDLAEAVEEAVEAIEEKTEE